MDSSSETGDPPDMRWVVLVPVMLACGGGDAPRKGDTGTTPGGDPPDLPPPACVDHAYLPLDRMGELVTVQPAPELSYDADGIAGLLETLGYTDLGPVTHGVDVWRVRYTTQDRGALAEATGLVLLPRVDGEVPLVLWHHFTAGLADFCAPSATGVLGAGLPLVLASRMGVAVAAPDYLGLDGIGAPSDQLHPYLVAEPTALSSLDAARAALALAEREGSPVRPDPSRVVLWGASQGGHAALWSDRYIAAYAPELTPVATVAAVPPTDVLALMDRGLSRFSPVSEALVALTVAAGDWYGLDPADGLLVEVADAARDELESTCNALDAARDRDDLPGLFTGAFLEGTDAWEVTLPAWACALGASSLGRSTLTPSGAPVMMVLAEDDDLAWSPPARADAERMCDAGVVVDLVECAGAGHEDAAADTLARQIAWIEDRLSGAPVPAPCALPPPEECTP